MTICLVPSISDLVKYIRENIRKIDRTVVVLSEIAINSWWIPYKICAVQRDEKDGSVLKTDRRIRVSEYLEGWGRSPERS